MWTLAQQIEPSASQAAPVLFGLLGAVTVGGAWAIVLSRNIVRSAVYLLITLMGVAGLYFYLEAELLAAVQLIVYAGGTLILIVFGVMLTHRGSAAHWNIRAWEQVVGVLLGLVLACLLGVAAMVSGLPAERVGSEGPGSDRPMRRIGGIPAPTRAGGSADAAGDAMVRGPARPGEPTEPGLSGERPLPSATSSPFSVNSPGSASATAPWSPSSASSAEPAEPGVPAVASKSAVRPSASLPTRPATQVEQLGYGLLTRYLLAFEVAGVLLLVVMVGAAYMARRRAGEPTDGQGGER